MAISAKLQKQLAALPAEPGVYLMRDAEGVIVYVGKATSLKQRVKSYFQAGVKHSPKTLAQMKVVDSLEWVVVSSPVEALILEANLIKEHNPKYNIMLRDDKHYPYLMVSVKEKYPRLLMVRSTRNDGNRYFGPYVSSTAMKLTQQLIEKIFPLRSCSNAGFKTRKRPCLNAHIGKCLAPCSGKVNGAVYRSMIDQVIWFLEGKTTDIIKNLNTEMEKASNELRFEDAARFRDQLRAVEIVQNQQQMDSGTDNRDMVGLAKEKETGVVQVFFVREGKVVGREHFFLEDHLEDEALPEEAAKERLLSAFIGQYYSGVDFIPPEICLSCQVEDMDTVAKWLTEKRGGKVQLSVPKIGPKRKLLDLVDQNAKLVLGRELEEQVYKRVAETTALTELKLLLSLPTLPGRIECFDNSHWQGTYTVSAMVTFCGGKPAKSLYRHMRIKNPTNGDDYLAMREAVSRRLGRGLAERERLKAGALKIEDAPMAVWPDLLLLDGGKGQLGVVMDILETLALDIPVVALAERLEELYLPGHKEPLVLPKNSPALQLLQRLRDEAHRFGVSYQRKLREKGQKESALDTIPGIGPVRRKALLAAFGSLDQIYEATLDRLELVPGFNKRAAKDLYVYLHSKKEEA